MLAILGVEHARKRRWTTTRLTIVLRIPSWMRISVTVGYPTRSSIYKSCVRRHDSSCLRHFFLTVSNAFPMLLTDSKLRVLQKGTTKKDLVTSLSVAKEDCIARLITSGNTPQSEEEAELASNPLIRHIAPHLQVSIWITHYVCLQLKPFKIRDKI